MTVSDLIAKLSALPPSALVVVANDAGSVEASPAEAATPGRYRSDATWSGRLLDAEDPAGAPCVVAWPVN